MIGVALLAGLMGLLVGYRLGICRCLLREPRLHGFGVPPPVPYRGSWPPADYED
jgi:hypothetical protein